MNKNKNQYLFCLKTEDYIGTSKLTKIIFAILVFFLLQQPMYAQPCSKKRLAPYYSIFLNYATTGSIASTNETCIYNIDLKRVGKSLALYKGTDCNNTSIGGSITNSCGTISFTIPIPFELTTVAPGIGAVTEHPNVRLMCSGSLGFNKQISGTCSGSYQTPGFTPFQFNGSFTATDRRKLL